MTQNMGGISGSRASTEPSGLGPSGFDPGRKDADFSVADILVWARTRPANEEYCYTSCGHCAVAQFLSDTGRAADPSVGAGYWRDSTGRAREFPEYLEDAVLARGGASRTFGALAKRLEALCPETPVTPSDWLTIDAYMADLEQVSA